MPLDNLFEQFSQVGQTLPGLGANTPSVLPSLPSQETVEPEIPGPPSSGDAYAEILREFAPLAAKARESAMNLPKDREDALYKEKIRKMFGVKLGEKNPKWKSILRVLGEGALDIGSTRYGGPTIRGAARKQALEDYKAENDVLGKESTSILARMGQAAQQANTANIAKMKAESAKAIQQAKNDLAKDPTNPKVQKIAAEIELLGGQNRLNEMRAKQAEMTALLNEKKAGIVGQTPEMLTAAGINKDPSLGAGIGMLEYLRAGGKRAGDLAGGGGQGRTSSHTGVKSVPNFFTGQMEDKQIQSSTTSGPTGNPEAAASFLKTLDAMRQKAGSPQTQPAVAGPNEGVAPVTAPVAPRQIVATPQGVRPAPVAPPQPVTQLPEDMSLPKLGSGTAGTRAKAALGAVEANFRKNGHLIKSVGETYLKLKDAATMTANLTDSAINSALTFQPGKNQSDLEQYSGARGIFNATKDTLSDKKPTSTGLSAVEIDTAANDLRHKITGAGAGYKELAMLRRNFPETPGSFSIQGHHTSLQKSLILHFIAQKVLWNNAHNIGNPEVFQNHFNEKLITDRIDSILNDYREYEKRVQASPPNKRKELHEILQNSINEKLDAQTMFESDWRNSQGIPSTAPGGNNKPRVIVIKPKR